MLSKVDHKFKSICSQFLAYYAKLQDISYLTTHSWRAVLTTGSQLTKVHYKRKKKVGSSLSVLCRLPTLITTFQLKNEKVFLSHSSIFYLFIYFLKAKEDLKQGTPQYHV